MTLCLLLKVQSLKIQINLSASSVLQGVDAVEVSRLPLIWQQIADRTVETGHSDPDFLVAMARLFYTKGHGSQL